MDGAPFGRSTDIFLNFASNVTNTQTDKMRRDEGLISVERKGASVNDQNSTNTRKKKTCWSGFYTRKENQSHKNCLSQWLEKKRDCVDPTRRMAKKKTKKKRKKYSKIIRKNFNHCNLARVQIQDWYLIRKQSANVIAKPCILPTSKKKNEKREEEEEGADNSRATKDQSLMKDEKCDCHRREGWEKKCLKLRKKKINK